MRKLIVVLLGAGLCAVCQAAPPTEQSISALLEASKAQLTARLITITAQSVRQGMNAALKGKTPTEKQQHDMDAIAAKFEQTMRDALAWDNVRPVYIQVYQETFTQNEVDDLTAFYKSPAGAALLDKMPTVFQKTSTLMQQRIAPYMDQMQADIAKLVAGGSTSE
jgi:uncharacterized protein